MGTYTVVLKQDRINEQGLGTVGGTETTVPAQSAMIMHN